MPLIKSAKKRVKVAAQARLRNSKSKRTMREAIKDFSKAVAAGKSTDVAAAQKEAVSAIDQAVKKNLIHKNKAARFKSRLSAQAKAAGVKPAKSTPAKTAPKKAPAKKSAAKKAPASKPAAKKK